MDGRPRIGLCAALERARWTVWDREAFLLSRAYVDALQAAGAIALMLPPDAWVAEHPDDVLDGLDGLVLAGGADIDPGSYGDPRHPKTTNTRPDRDRAEIALALRALERDLPVLGHLPRDAADQRRAAAGRWSSTCPTTSATPTTAARSAPSTTPTTTCGWRRARWPRGRAARLVHATKSHHHQAVDALGEGVVATRLERARRPGRGDRGARRALGAGRPVAPGGRPALARRALVRGRSRARPAPARAVAALTSRPQRRQGGCPYRTRPRASIYSRRPCPARPPSARPPARCSPPASRRRCSAAGCA